MKNLLIIASLLLQAFKLRFSFNLMQLSKRTTLYSRRYTRYCSGECNLSTEGSITSNDPKSSGTVWTVFGELAKVNDAINLGQGYPDWNPPQFLLDSLRQTVETPFHQYTRPSGHPPLVELLAKRYSQHLHRNINPFNEIAITVGASQALYLAFTTILNPGDEVILFEPFFDLYLKQLKLTGAVPKFVPLGGNAGTEDDPWALDVEKLKSLVELLVFESK
jgi:aspartate/methionine/tyrosine aminotransferase